MLEKIYKAEGSGEIATFKKWQEKGYKVRKGAKALILWSAPVRIGSKKDVEPDDKSGFEFYGVAHVFSINDVEKI